MAHLYSQVGRDVKQSLLKSMIWIHLNQSDHFRKGDAIMSCVERSLLQCPDPTPANLVQAMLQAVRDVTTCTTSTAQSRSVEWGLGYLQSIFLVWFLSTESLPVFSLERTLRVCSLLYYITVLQASVGVACHGDPAAPPLYTGDWPQIMILEHSRE